MHPHSLAYQVYSVPLGTAGTKLGDRDFPEMKVVLHAGLEPVRVLSAAEVVLDSVVREHLKPGIPLPPRSIQQVGEYLPVPSPALVAGAAQQRP